MLVTKDKMDNLLLLQAGQLIPGEQKLEDWDGELRCCATFSGPLQCGRETAELFDDMAEGKADSLLAAQQAVIDEQKERTKGL